MQLNPTIFKAVDFSQLVFSGVLFTETQRNFSIYKFHFMKNYNITWVHIAFFWQEAVLWSTVNTVRVSVDMSMGELVTLVPGLGTGVHVLPVWPGVRVHDDHSQWYDCWFTQAALTLDRRIFSQMMIPWFSLIIILQKPATSGDPNRYQPLKSLWPWTSVVWFDQVHHYFSESHHSLPQCCLTHLGNRGN